ncbi:MAG TPA: DegT/DnrJ/EryC1/StrS family aminotransferase [Thermoanaerobaculia bacterium]|nr:DegT/DnrJ/EryC1/StrS family aminotransferase [Thermoanaerobaculia bacterium]
MTRVIPLFVPDVDAEDFRLVHEVLTSRRLASGSVAERFELEFAARFGVRHAIAVSSGTAALHLAIIAAGVRENDLVLTTPYSFVASSNAILYERGIPLFVDIDPVTLDLSPAKTCEAIETLVQRRAGWQLLLPRTCNASANTLRAVLPVHLFGRPAELRDIVALSRRHAIPVLEDACEALGARIDGELAGSWGSAATFGFYPNKQITSGEGGMLVTNDDAWMRLFRSLRNQGRAADPDALRYERLGFNYRMDELSAALGLAQLRRLDTLLQRRESVARRYARLLANVDGISPLAAPRRGMTVSWFLYVIRLAPDIDRDRLRTRLAARGIASQPYFWPIHLQPFYVERFGFREGDFPNAEAAGRSLLALPFGPNLSDDDVAYVCDAVIEELEQCRETAPLARCEPR